LKARRDRGVSAADHAAGLGNRVVRPKPANLLRGHVRTCAHRVPWQCCVGSGRVLAGLLLAVSCAFSPSAYGQGLDRLPSFKHQPKSQAVELGTPAFFIVRLASTTTSYEYQWEMRPEGAALFADLPHKTNDSLTIQSVRSANRAAPSGRISHWYS